jgi:YggT family protein
MSVARDIVINLTDIILGGYTIIIFANVILSWFVPPTNAFKQFLDFLTAPVLRPVRRLLQPLMAKSSIPLDFSPFVVLLLLSLLRQLLYVLWTAIL